MRDLFVTVVVFGLLPLILRRPWLGILAWSWLGYMNPHRMAWGFSTTMPFAFMVAITTLVAMLASSEPKRIPWTRETILLLLMTGWMFLTTCFALVQDPAWEQWNKVWRIMLMTYVTMILITDEYRIKMLMFVIALSLGFYGFKGGLFTATGGSAERVMGPQGSFIGDNNSVGLALIMTVPLLRFMQLQMTHRYARNALFGGIGLTLIAIIGTHSRGALVGLVAMLFFYLLKSRKKVTALLAVIPLAVAMFYIMPQEYFERMETIQTWEEDDSASERVRAWGNAIDLANERFMGGGMRALVYYGGREGRGRDSHSIYFGMLGENGWVGLGMFLLLLFFTWRSGSWILSHTRHRDDLLWARDLAAMVQVSLVGYMSAGAFLGLQYFDLFYHLMAIIVVTRVLLERQFAEEKKNGTAVGNAYASHGKEGHFGRVGTLRRGTAGLGGKR
jgi:probable O-glycosylation ligase (exosortase A-associated)